MVARHGWWVAAHYGSPAGELALCETAVGLADRSDLGKLELRGEPARSSSSSASSAAAASTRATRCWPAGAWWCAVSPHPRARALRRRRDRPPSAAAVAEAVRWTPGATATDVTPRYAAIGLLGPRATDVLLDELSRHRAAARRGRRARLRRAAARRRPGDAAARSADTRGRAHRGRPRAPRLWTEIERAGREAGIGHVGADAVSHLSPLAR